MKNSWVLILLLGGALAAGCNDRPADAPPNSTQNPDLTAPAGAPEATPSGTPQGNTPRAVPGRSAGSQLTTPTRGAAAPLDAGHQAAAPERQLPQVPASAASNTPAAPPAPRWRDVTVAAGTSLPLELTTALSSETASVETPVRARLRRAVVVDGLTVIPVGTVFTGHVTDVARAGRVQGRARLAFSFSEATIDGGREELRTNPVAFEAEATKGEDAKKIGIGAGIGAAIGAIAGGGDGAAKGAAIGGAAGTGAVLATRGREVELGSGADITATLASPLRVRVEQ